MRLNSPAPASNGFTKLASFVIVAGVLYFAQEVFIPIALATLLSFLLAPLVLRLTRLGLGKIPSILIVVTLTFTAIGVIGWLVMAQVIHLADQLPEYRQNLRSKVESLKKPHGQGVFSRATGMMTELQKEIASLTPTSDDGGTNAVGRAVERPIPVEVRAPKPTPIQVIANIIGPVLKPLGTAAAVVFFVVLMLFQREDLRERFLKLVSGGELNVATEAVDDATQRVSRYLLMQLVVNATYGIPIGIGLYFIGVPNAFLWGLLATLLRFIPFVGPWIAAAFPMALAIAVDPGWTKPVLTAGLFLIIELISNNVIEPWLYGASTGISNIALLVAAIFWTWLWGTIGLLLSTPLTVCLLVLGKYVPGLSFLSVLLGSDPVLEPEARFYQRMLAMDEDELTRLSTKYVQEKSLTEFYDKVVIPALSFAEQDRHKGSLAEVRQAFIVQNTREIIDALGEREAKAELNSATASAKGDFSSSPVLCVPARDESDELAGLMLAQLLDRAGLPARAMPAKTLAGEWFKEIRNEGITTVCISGIPPFAVNAARQTCKRLKHEFPNLKIIIGIWDPAAHPTEVAGRLASSCSDAVVTRLADAVTRVESVLEAAEIAKRHTPLKPIDKPLVDAPPTAALESEPEEIFASITRQAAKIMNVPVSLVSLIDTDGEFWKSHGGLPADLSSAVGLRETSLGTMSAPTDDVIDVPDIAQDLRYANDPVLKARGIRFYTGVPLRTRGGHVVGILCITDTEPHQVSDRAKALLRSLGNRLISEVEKRQALQAA